MTAGPGRDAGAAPSNPSPATRGRKAEDFALTLLQENGFTLVERNFRCKGGELDLVMRDNDEIVFVEVRYRQADDFGDGGESVDRWKQRKLRIAAETWLQRHDAMTFRGCRFAVMSVSGDPTAFLHEWIDDAF